MARDIVDHKARTHLDGVGRVSNESAWGEQKATDRYGGGTRTYGPQNEDASFPQKLGDRNNLPRSTNYNDTPNNWLRGAGESAEQKPGYVKGYRVPYGDDHRHDSVEDQPGQPPLREGSRRR